MPGVDLPTNQIQDFLLVFKRKRWSILISALTGFTLAMIVLCFVPPKYKSFTRVEVREVSIDEEPANRSQVRMQIKDLQNVSFQVLSSPRIVRVIKDQLQWADFLQVEGSLIERQEYLDGIVKRTVVDRARKERDVGNDYVTITYRDEDPKRAAAFANKLRDVWIQETIGAIRDDVQRQVDEAKRQLDRFQKDYTIATQNVQRWQEQYGLSPVNPTNRKVTSEEDPVVKQFLQAKQDLARAESEMNRHYDIYTSARDRFASEPLYIQEPIDERTAAASPQFDSTRALLDQVKSLKEDITRLKAEQKVLKPSNKKFGIKQQDIDAKAKELKDLEQQLSKAGLSTNGDKPMTREILNPAKLAAKEETSRAEADYKTRKNEFESLKNNVAELEVQSQRRAFIYTRYNQYQNDEDYFKSQYLDAKKLHEKRTTLLEQLRTAAMNPYKILDEAVPSERPVEPPVFLYLVGGLIGGGGATIALTFLRELARSGYRSVQDASSSLSLPVLGYVNRMDTRSELQGARRRQVIGIATSLTAILLLCGTASLYLLQPKLLPSPMKQALDTVKRNLK